MLDWIVVSGGLAAFSMAALELFRETGPSLETEIKNSASTWQTMGDADLDKLLEEFSRAGGEDTRPDLRLAA